MAKAKTATKKRAKRKTANRAAGGKPTSKRASDRELAKRAARSFIQSRGYDAAKTNRINKKHWADATSASADSIIFTALEVLRNRARHEIRNNGYAEGMAETYALDCVGRDGPRLQIQSDDDKWNQAVETGFAEWCEECDVGGRLQFVDILKLLVRGFFDAGEGLVQHVTARVMSPVRHRLLVVEPDRLSTPVGMEGDDVRNGVKVDPETGAAISYFILKDHPGALNYSGSVGEYSEVPARYISHLYKLLRPGQTRGVPWLAPGLDLFGQLRDLTFNTLLAAEYAAALAVLIFSDHQEAEFDDCDGEYDVVDIEPGTMSMLPRGWKASQIKPEQPPAVYGEFKRELLREIGRVVGMPYLIIGCDASGHNYSSARMDNQQYWEHIASTQSFIGRHLATPNVKQWVNEAFLDGYITIPPRKWKATWTWNQPRHVDPAKEEAATALRLANGTSTWAVECKAKGLDWQEVFTQLAREKKFAEEQGLELDFGALVLKAAAIISSQKDDDAKEDGK